MVGIAESKGDRSFASVVAADSHGGAAVVVHRARMFASPCCPRTLQYALHELVARPRQGTHAEDHAAALIRSSWSRVPYLSRFGSCLELFARSFGCAATSTGSAACAVDRRSARSDGGFGLFVQCGVGCGRAGA